MWVDEEMLGLNVRDRGFSQLAGPLWLNQSAPFGWLVLERMTMLVLGTGERAVRTLTVLFGIGTLTTAWWIGRRWMTPLGAAVLVALCGTSEWLVFFTLELKHYSADAAGALLIPALAAWTLDDDRCRFGRRAVAWWAAAAVAMWFSNGALFVTPLCAVVLFGAVIIRRNKPKREARNDAIRFFLGGFGWLASFGICYAVVLRPALGNSFLKEYWAFAFPPTADGVGATASWLISQLLPFAVKPISTRMPGVFWAAYVAGIATALARRSSIAIAFATVPVSAVLLAVAHFVPTFERLAIWTVPAFYVGVALCADSAFVFAASGVDRVRRLPAAVVLGGLALLVSYDVVKHGVFAIEHRPRSNYGLDDRASVKWLLDVEKPGDAILTTHLGLPAVWWYSGTSIADLDRSGRLRTGTPLYVIHHVEDEAECPRWWAALDAIARDHSRIVVYLAFRMNVEPEGFDRLVLEEFGRRWPLVGYKEYAEVSRMAIFDLAGGPGGPVVIPPRPGAAPEVPVPIPPGCVSVTPASRW
jgi:hypothetical protein